MKRLVTIIGDTEPPPVPNVYQDVETGLPALLGTGIKALIVIAGLYALFNFIIAGYEFMSAGGDSKRIAVAWTKIWQSVLGLVVAAGAVIIAAIIGGLLFRDFNALLQIRFFGPG
jgi:hypothetical protein